MDTPWSYVEICRFKYPVKLYGLRVSGNGSRKKILVENVTVIVDVDLG